MIRENGAVVCDPPGGRYRFGEFLSEGTYWDTAMGRLVRLRVVEAEVIESRPKGSRLGCPDKQPRKRRKATEPGPHEPYKKLPVHVAGMIAWEREVAWEHETFGDPDVEMIRQHYERTKDR